MSPSGSKPHTTPHLAAIESLFGPLPPNDISINVQLAHEIIRPDHVLSLWHVTTESASGLNWWLHIAWPANKPYCPVLLSPDGCWPHVVNNQALQVCIKAGVALAWFNRIELAYDRPDGIRKGPVHSHWPDTAWSATSIWAWGIQRSVDVLQRLSQLNKMSIGVIGHSRGGKAVLIAGALDKRIDFTIAHNSGTGGSASLQVEATGAESLKQLQVAYPHWLRPELACNDVQQAIVDNNAPQQWLRAIAPRGLCILQACDDLWAHPQGTRHMVQLLRPFWTEFPDRLQLMERNGGHSITPLDWQRAVDFVHNTSEEKV